MCALRRSFGGVNVGPWGGGGRSLYEQSFLKNFQTDFAFIELNSKSLVIEVQILTIEFTEAEMKNVFLVYTFVGQELQWTSQGIFYHSLSFVLLI